MAEPEPDAGDVDEAEETVCGFVVAGCQAATVLEFVEAAFVHVAQGTPSCNPAASRPWDGKKEPPDRPRNQPCQPSGKPSLIPSLVRHPSDALTVKSLSLNAQVKICQSSATSCLLPQISLRKPYKCIADKRCSLFDIFLGRVST